MNQELWAVFENGVFRPRQPLQLPHHQRVIITIPDPEVRTETAVSALVKPDMSAEADERS